MTEKEKALAYIQMLKNEGKLDENALHELTGMYNISQEEARELLHSFRQTKAYEKGAAKNIAYYVWLTVITAGAAAKPCLIWIWPIFRSLLTFPPGVPPGFPVVVRNLRLSSLYWFPCFIVSNESVVSIVRKAVHKTKHIQMR